VWVAIAGPGGGTARLLTLGGDRLAIRKASCDAVLELLARELGVCAHAQTEVTRREEGGLG
jgi:hypothetical protein